MGNSRRSVRQMCREGALAQAIRDIRKRVRRDRIKEILLKKLRGACSEDIDTILDIAYRSVWAANAQMMLGPDDQLPPGTIPRLPG